MLPVRPPWRLGLWLLVLFILAVTIAARTQEPPAPCALPAAPPAPKKWQKGRRLASKCILPKRCTGDWVQDEKGRWHCDGYFEGTRVCPVSVEELKQEGK